TRSGHCEYFATAAALLLRKAGVPSRYITGYAVNERSGNKNVFLVRGRHAHAWTLAHVDGKWQYFDTTPPNWGEIARQEDSVWEAFYDVWDQVIFLFYKWRWGERKDISSYMGLLLVPLILFLVWRIFFGKSPVSIEKKGKGPKKDANLLPGKDSEFYKVMEYLKSEGLGRHSWEPLFQWIERIEKNKNFHISVDKIKKIVSLHYRYRFDPDGITQKEKKSLQFLVQNWVNDYENNLQ
ncbi:MAG: transglutaminase domain-containing protein, partial [Thermodesulfobacteriota bacterium]|nr:transglutaminase domain-containing protein [Thermodesulfobacteriota bacterium]